MFWCTAKNCMPWNFYCGYVHQQDFHPEHKNDHQVRFSVPSQFMTQIFTPISVRLKIWNPPELCTFQIEAFEIQNLPLFQKNYASKTICFTENVWWHMMFEEVKCEKFPMKLGDLSLLIHQTISKLFCYTAVSIWHV